MLWAANSKFYFLHKIVCSSVGTSNLVQRA